MLHGAVGIEMHGTMTMLQMIMPQQPSTANENHTNTLTVVYIAVAFS